VTDIDGNTYYTVLIGTQEWMAENLKVTRYRNGDAIPNVTDIALWTNATEGAWCTYNNNPANKGVYGLLYNFYAVADSRSLCPTGWHVPSDTEWTTLTDYLGGEAVAGLKLKVAKWESSAPGSNNISGFTALPAGSRYGYDGLFSTQDRDATFWTSSIYNAKTSWYRGLYYLYPSVFRETSDNKGGHSLRCIKD